jgi:hypothetical protein
MSISNDGLNNLLEESRAILKATSVLIGALVSTRLKKLVDKVSIGTVNLDTIKPSHFCVTSSDYKLLNRLLNLLFRQRNWSLMLNIGAANVFGMSRSYLDIGSRNNLVS